MEQTLVILKPSAIARGLMGEILSRIERKGLIVTGMKMMQLDENILKEHYAHLVDRPFFPSIVESMTATPVVVMCLEGVDVVAVFRKMVGRTGHSPWRSLHERTSKHNPCLRLCGKCSDRNQTFLQSRRNIRLQAG